MMLSFGLFQPSIGRLGFWATTAAIAVSISTSAQAAVLSQWSFDTSSHQLRLSLPADVKPQYFLLAEPARIVLDIPNAQIGAVSTAQTYTGAIRSIRVAQFEADTIRIVVELAPGVVLEPQQATLAATATNGENLWVLQPLIAGEPAIAATPTATPTPDGSETALAAEAAVVAPSAAPTLPDQAETASSPVVDETFVSPASPLSAPSSEASETPALPETTAEGIGLSAANLRPEPSSLPQNDLPTTPLTGVNSPAAGAVTVSVPPLPIAPLSAAEETTPASPTELEPDPTPPSDSPTTPAPATVKPPFLEPIAPPQPAAPTVIMPPTATEATAAPTIPFGQPLPGTDQSAVPAASSQVAQRYSDRPVLISAGMLLSLQYTEAEPLALTQPLSYQEVLVLSQDIRNPQTNELLVPEGAQVIGRFDLTEATPRFVAQAISLQGENLPLLAESEGLGEPQVSGSNILRNSGLGAAAVTVLSGFSGIGLIAGAALGAATTYATSPQVVVIQPNQIIQVQVLADLLR
ncbi:MAG: AMIN domain-containing protein [Leptolyngbyaceae cyanobacterium RM1_1_2]|nr:AMIN domain-containing protein [Leptolyngbyaceae cyanobacterium RM1_1_2]